MKVLLIGGSGQLGTELILGAPSTWDVIAPQSEHLNLSAPEGIASAVSTIGPDLVVNAAAFHIVDLCESRFGEALNVNAAAVARLAQSAASIGARFVTISSDYVFDGRLREPYREDDFTSPIQCYGISKVAGELAALACNPGGSFVIRTCGLYGRSTSRQKGNFVLSRLKDARQHNTIEVGCDLTCTPTSAADLASAIRELLLSPAPPGIYHLTNSGSCNWATFASCAFEMAKVDTRIEPVDRKGLYGPARRPPYSVMSNLKAAKYGVFMRPWQDALADYVGELTEPGG